ncbi:hypothetical protein BATDEDRAFT_84926 [Batrachochytrium dendrobatidis JAM81]|uniref:Ataxin-10 homolog n=1 Tax=Batrachochytrium dendrobatidis (strain JAM81 / FGSC 10211) TaxID=684364 RepID=F4NRU9_BATDJ|nr:uncharacterized protein BATDEDRAFT_84926 [Batrachochytrium dendrobatidis JAM81]EGF83378.1 hypothetical protein BATDEDRAFT_84926 [Batrachochytrium dendrobatidis JAM81]|eukprot:XP_006676082.1 hypothetical protein BATDEDRAFT_84926 [Batrachochytrium dendrobatidis JAM81]
MESLSKFVQLMLLHVELPVWFDKNNEQDSQSIDISISQLSSQLAFVNEQLIKIPQKRRFPRVIETQIWKLYEAQLVQVKQTLQQRSEWERTSSIYFKLIKKLFEWMRNTCADVPENQWIASEIQVHTIVNDILLDLIDWRNHAGEESERKDATQAIDMGMQALSNMCTSNTLVQSSIWQFFVRESQLLSLFLLFADPASVNKDFVDNITGSEAIASILNVFANESGTQTDNFELSYSCIKNLLISDLAPAIWTSLEQIENGGMSSVHVALLKALDGMVNGSAQLNVSLPNTSKLISRILVSTTKKLQTLLSTPEPQLDSSIQHICTFVVLVLQYLGVASQISTEAEISSWVDDGLAKSLITLLHGVSKLQPIFVDKSSSPSHDIKSNIFFMIRCDIMKVIANITYTSQQAQNEIRMCDGIPLVLSNCVIDDLNPYLREYALFAVRNLTKNNRENQMLIASLEARKVVPNEILTEMGVEAAIDPVTGKLTFK